MTLSTRIIERLNAQDAIDNGLSNGDAFQSSSKSVEFTYPAPVISGACVATLEIYADGSIWDDTSETHHADFDAFVADLESMMEA